jgi:hypothetical protein
LREGTVLGSLSAPFDDSQAAAYLASVREELPIYAEQSVAHPGWLLRFANTVLSSSVVLGPWIHVSSDVQMLDLVESGATIEVRARVTGEYERRGHRFVGLDVVVLADDRPVQRIAHTAIHTPRRVAAVR